MSALPPEPEAEILLVEDCPGDARLMQEALAECGARSRVHVVRDGVEAMQYLRRNGRHGEARMPALILLDLNMPRKDGREVLAEIKNNNELKVIPVVVLTTSGAEEDIVASYRLHANSYITKPADLSEFVATVKTIEEFWLKVVRRPRVV